MSKIPGFRSGKTWKKIVASLSYLFIFLIIVSIAKGGGSSSSTPTTAPAKQDSAQAQKADTAQPAQTQASAQQQPAPAPSVKTYKAGMYKIGADMPAGEYVLIGNGMAYYQVAKDSTGQLNSLVSNDNFSNRSIITVSEGQYLTLQRCTAYAFKDAPKVDTSSGTLPEGMYKVGVDLPAGEYKVNSDSMGYVEVSSNSTHDMGSIISNDNFQGEKYITVKDGQYIKLARATLKLK